MVRNNCEGGQGWSHVWGCLECRPLFTSCFMLPTQAAGGGRGGGDVLVGTHFQGSLVCARCMCAQSERGEPWRSGVRFPAAHPFLFLSWNEESGAARWFLMSQEGRNTANLSQHPPWVTGKPAFYPQRLSSPPAELKSCPMLMDRAATLPPSLPMGYRLHRHSNGTKPALICGNEGARQEVIMRSSAEKRRFFSA